MPARTDSPAPVPAPSPPSPLPARAAPGLPPVVVVAQPALQPDGRPKAPAARVAAAREAQTARRLQFWTAGPGAREFLARVVAVLNASPHLAGEGFRLAFDAEMRRQVTSRVERWADEDDAAVREAVLRCADEVAYGLLGGLVRGRRFQEHDLTGVRPTPFRYATYTGGGGQLRGGAQALDVGRTSPFYAAERYAAFLYKHGLQ